ncbi:hypothetical protein FGG78_03365 [Thioclava sp. BHET1]|nr:hypothetical protein FGG78_03365 [Thioclava sp. BHET1]
MPERHLSLYLPPTTRSQAAAGDHNFFNRLTRALEAADWTVSLHETGAAARRAARHSPGYVMYHMEPPTHARALTCRRSYFSAFWHVEASAERWEWPVAKATFNADDIDGTAAGGFFGHWQKRLYSGVNCTDRQNLALIALQGKLTQHRSFQSMSPLEMIEAVLARHPGPTVATLHPKETYARSNINALERIAARFSRFSFQMGGSHDLLPHCSFLVTQNSGLALDGYFLRKPAIFFGRSDIDHIAGSVPRDGIDAAFARRHQAPPVARYLYWRFALHALNAGRPEFEETLRGNLRGFGWPI